MKSRNGFTLFEAVISLAIISMVAVGTLAAVGAQLRATDHALHTTEAASLAENRMAVVRVLTHRDLQSLPDSIAAGRFAPPLNIYTWRVTSEPVVGADGLNAISIRIEWPDGSYSLSSRAYRSPPVVSQPGPGQGT